MALPPEDEELEAFEDLSSLFMTSIPTVGAYTISGLPDGTYSVIAFVMDMEMMGAEDDWEPTVIGVYGMLLAPELVEITGGAAITGIDVELIDMSEWVAVAPRSWAQVKAAFK